MEENNKDATIETVVVKRDNREEKFNPAKIEKAILKAMRTGGVYKKKLASMITEEATEKFTKKEKITHKDIDDFIQKSLTSYGQSLTAQSYLKYRTLKEYRKEDNEIVHNVMGIVDRTNKSLIEENANKDYRTLSTSRDLIAGEVSKLVARKIMPEELVLANEAQIVKTHDLDYYTGFNEKNGTSVGMINCMLVNLKEMFENGTVINGKAIKNIHSFNKACTVASQIALAISSGQYGGQTHSISHLAPFVRKSKERWYELISSDKSLTEEQINTAVDVLLQKEIKDGIKTLNYQLNTFMSCNGQSPFISLFLYINEDKEYAEETAMLIEEIFKQRIEGMENEFGHKVIQTFPKLLYVLEPENLPGGGGKYEYLSDLAAECAAKTMNPDFISYKIMHEKYAEYDSEGNEIHDGVFPCMGCRSFLSKWINPETGKPQYYGRFNKGVFSLNLPDIALSSEGDFDVFWKILDERLEILHKMAEGRVTNLIMNSDRLDSSPIHWKYGAISRLKDGENNKHLLEGGYSTTSLGFIGVHEMCMVMFGKSHNESEEAHKFAIDVLSYLKNKTTEWNKLHNIGYSLYASPSEGYSDTSLRKTKERFGVVKGVTDHEFFTNSYHIYVEEEVDVFSKFSFESEFQNLCTGGCISYAECGNLTSNIEVVKEIMRHIYENIQYAEINLEVDVCNNCGSRVPLKQDDNDEFYCGCCGSYCVTANRRICGYIGEASRGINKGKRHEMKLRIKHI